MTSDIIDDLNAEAEDLRGQESNGYSDTANHLDYLKKRYEGWLADEISKMEVIGGEVE